MTLLLRGMIQRYNIACVWHFTDAANVGSIRQLGGIFSLRELDRRGIAIPAPGGDALSHQIDRRKGLDQYVRLCFKKQHPMEFRAREEGRIRETAWMKVSSDIILNPEVRFSIGVAYMDGVEMIDHQRFAREMDFEVLYCWTDWNDPAIQARLQQAEKSEALVPHFVPMRNIMEIC